VLDYAGGTVVHMASGFAGLVAAKYLGLSLAAAGRNVAAGDTSNTFWWDSQEPANVPIVVLGTTLLWGGWFGVSWLLPLIALGPQMHVLYVLQTVVLTACACLTV
jgi:Amt family ammonium transporter